MDTPFNNTKMKKENGKQTGSVVVQFFHTQKMENICSMLYEWNINRMTHLCYKTYSSGLVMEADMKLKNSVPWNYRGSGYLFLLFHY